MKIAILHARIPEDAAKDEQDALIEVQCVARALDQLGHTWTCVPLDLNLSAAASQLQQIGPEKVFNLVESIDGKGSLIHLAPSLLDALAIPYTGATTSAMFLTSNKLLAKQMLRAARLPTPDWITHNQVPDPNELESAHIVKSVWEHASVGLDRDAVVHDRSQLVDAFESRRASRCGECFAETFVDGREFNVALLAATEGPEILPVAEIQFLDFPADEPRMVGYRAKWDPDSTEYKNTPRRFDLPVADHDLIVTLKTLALACWDLFQLQGYARVDFRVDANGQPWILEINANPCLSPDAGFLAAANRAHLSAADVVRRILAAPCIPAQTPPH